MSCRQKGRGPAVVQGRKQRRGIGVEAHEQDNGICLFDGFFLIGSEIAFLDELDIELFPKALEGCKRSYITAGNGVHHTGTAAEGDSISIWT